ncbi:COR domain-containing protein [Crocosphaera sp. XPORK-15E]|nr:COR domain-containing protein [Crocosphaera sp. XPORK-15E]MEA5535423.1 COR domain-containing protein [Crocosphaera sp. XPORK-15E]
MWNEEKYITMHGELLRLMMNFKLCYEIPSQPGNYIAPQLLSTEQPEYNWDEENNLLLRYEYEFMPKGIITRFIVETHAIIENETCVWKTGVVLNKDGARAEIIELYRYHKGEIRIRVTGNRKRDLLTTVRHELDKIHKSYERLEYKTLVPCNCSKCKGSQSPDFYLWNILNKYIDDKEPTIKCNNSYAMVNVQGLVNDIVRPDLFTFDNKEENPMSDQRTFNFYGNTQYHEKNQAEGNQNNYTSDSSIKNSLDEIREMLNKLNHENPNINETEATEIIQAEFTEIQRNQPQKWEVIKPVFDRERWLNGGKTALIKVGEHYSENNVFYKAAVGFVEGFTESE